MTNEWKELRRRRKALKACGHADWLQCRFCKKWDSTDTLRVYTATSGGYSYQRAEHPACLSAHVGRQRAKKPEHYRAYDKARGSDRPNRAESIKKDNASPKKKERSKRYYVNGGKQTVRANWRKYRARLNGAEGSHTEEEWLAVLVAANYTCAGCGRTDVPLTEDHIVPITKGGSDFIANIQPLCRSCNARKGNREAT